MPTIMPTTSAMAIGTGTAAATSGSRNSLPTNRITLPATPGMTTTCGRVAASSHRRGYRFGHARTDTSSDQESDDRADGRSGPASGCPAAARRRRWRSRPVRALREQAGTRAGPQEGHGGHRTVWQALEARWRSEPVSDVSHLRGDRGGTHRRFIRRVGRVPGHGAAWSSVGIRPHRGLRGRPAVVSATPDGRGDDRVASAHRPGGRGVTSWNSAACNGPASRSRPSDWVVGSSVPTGGPCPRPTPAPCCTRHSMPG